MIDKAVKVEYKFIPKSNLSCDKGPARWVVMIYEAAYRDDGTMYPKIVNIWEQKGTTRGRKFLESYVQLNFANIVDELDDTPLIAQMF